MSLLPRSHRQALLGIAALVASCWPVAGVGATAAPEFSLPGMQSAVSLEAYRGQVVYVDFWASWCVPCRHSFPWMDALQQRHRDAGLQVVAINLDQQSDEAWRFLQDTQPGFTVAFDPAGDVARAYGVRGMPSSYVIDRQGQVAFSHIGFRKKDMEKLETAISEVLAQ